MAVILHVLPAIFPAYYHLAFDIVFLTSYILVFVIIRSIDFLYLSRLFSINLSMCGWVLLIFQLSQLTNVIFLRESRLSWFGHVYRSFENSTVSTAYELNVPGKLPQESPKQRWLDTFNADLSHLRVTTNLARDRTTRRKAITYADPIH